MEDENGPFVDNAETRESDCGMEDSNNLTKYDVQVTTPPSCSKFNVEHRTGKSLAAAARSREVALSPKIAFLSSLPLVDSSYDTASESICDKGVGETNPELTVRKLFFGA